MPNKKGNFSGELTSIPQNRKQSFHQNFLETVYEVWPISLFCIN